MWRPDMRVMFVGTLLLVSVGLAYVVALGLLRR